MSARSPSTRQRRRDALLFIVAVAALAIIAPPAAAMLSPAITLVALLWLDLFPDEQVVAWARRIVRRLRRRVARPGRPAPLPRAPRPAAAGIELAFALAMRPPPRSHFA